MTTESPLPLSEQEHEVVLEAAVTSMREHPDSWMMYDESVVVAPHVVRAMYRYDPQVFLRFNRITKRWELWRWRGGRPEVPTHRVRKQDVKHRAVFCYTIRERDGSYMPPGEYLQCWLWLGDPWRKFTDDPREGARRFDEETILEDAQDEKDYQTVSEDWAHDNRRQIDAFFGRGSSIYVMPGEKKDAA